MHSNPIRYKAAATDLDLSDITADAPVFIFFFAYILFNHGLPMMRVQSLNRIALTFLPS